MNVNPTFFVIMVELLAVESIALVIITVLFVRRKFQYKHAVENIIAAAESSEAARQKVLEQTLKDVFNEDEADANSKAQQLAKAESRFCKRLITAFVSRKHGILSRLDKMTDELLSPYRSLISETAQEKVRTKKKMSKNINSLKHTIESLKEEKLKITEQLAETEHELNNIMSEYVSAFQKEEQLKQEQEAQEETTESSSDAAAQAEPSDDAAEESITVTDEGPEPLASKDEATTAENAGMEGIEITDEDTAADVTDSDDEDEGLLKLEDIDETSDGDEISVTDDITDDIAVTDEIDEIMDDATTAAADSAAAPQNPRTEDETPQASGAADDADAREAEQESGSGTTEPAAILEDVDISNAPLMEEIAADNSAKPKSAAAR